MKNFGTSKKVLFSFLIFLILISVSFICENHFFEFLISIAFSLGVLFCFFYYDKIKDLSINTNGVKISLDKANEKAAELIKLSKEIKSLDKIILQYFADAPITGSNLIDSERLYNIYSIIVESGIDTSKELKDIFKKLQSNLLSSLVLNLNTSIFRFNNSFNNSNEDKIPKKLNFENINKVDIQNKNELSFKVNKFDEFIQSNTSNIDKSSFKEINYFLKKIKSVLETIE